MGDSTRPIVFAPGIVSTDGGEYGPAFSPDGKTLYFTKRTNWEGYEVIVLSRWKNEEWSMPVAAPFSGTYYDKEPFVSPNGRELFFASTRPEEPGGDEDAFDLWVVQLEEGSWGVPRNLGPNVNSDKYDNYPSVAANGNLYFASTREGGLGRNDLYVSRYVNGEYLPAENLRSLNTPASDADPYIAPSESYMIFSSTREGSLGAGDLYVSFNENGQWTNPQNLGPVVNTSSYEYTPLVSPDGRYLFFSRDDDIFQLVLNISGFTRLLRKE